MKNTNSNVDVTESTRDDVFSTRPVTKIWQEVPSDTNAYIAKQCLCHGYDLLELIAKASFPEVLFLLFRGELPSVHQTELLEKWWISSINPGPRFPATKAALNAGVGKTNAVNILPLSLAVLGGDYLGATEVKRSMRFLQKNLAEDPTRVATDLLRTEKRPITGDWHIAPGFGTRFGGRDIVPNQIGELLSQLKGANSGLRWSEAFARSLEPHAMGWLDPSVAAVVQENSCPE